MATEVNVGQQLLLLRGTEKQADVVARMKATGVAELQISQQRLSDWEGGSRPPYEVVLALADFWGVRVRWLLTGEGEKKPRPAGEAEKILAEIRRLVTELSADALEEAKTDAAARVEPFPLEESPEPPAGAGSGDRRSGADRRRA